MEINWKQLVCVSESGERVPCENGTELSVRTQAIRCGEYTGCAGYVTLHAGAGLGGNPSALLAPVWEDSNRFLAIVNHSPYWCRPFWGDTLAALPERTQELLLERDGVYTCILPVCDSVCKTVLHGRGESGGWEFVIATNMDGMKECPEQLSFVALQGKDLRGLLTATAKTAADMLGNGMKMRAERKYPEVLEWLGWCSWDAFHIHVDHKGLLEKAKEFKEKNVPIGYAIIDDMWADVPGLNDIGAEVSVPDMITVMHASKMRRIEGDPERFPKGMRAAVQDLKKEGIPNVGVWFPTTGYWSGIEPGSPAEQELGESLATTSKGWRIAAPDEKRAQDYFYSFCGKIRSWGADFVKIDNQGCHGKYRNMAPFGKSAKAIQSAVESASDRYFGGALINCMGMPNECLFFRQHSAVCRCSDDFQPENSEWFTKNVLQSAYNGLLQGQYHVNDWDMWWTDDAQAVKNGVCRAISGGPIYVSDKLGRTKPELLKPVALANGRLLRCDESAAPSEDCLLENPTKSGRVFKIVNRAGNAGVVAALNISAEGTPVSGCVRPADAGIHAEKVAWYEYFSGRSGILSAGEELPVTLETQDQFGLYTFVPMDESGVAVIGRTDLYVGVLAARKEGEQILLAERGPIGFVSERPIHITQNGKDLSVSRNGLFTATVTESEEPLTVTF